MIYQQSSDKIKINQAVQDNARKGEFRKFRYARPKAAITDPILQQAGGRLFAHLNEEDNHGSSHDYGNAFSEGYIQRWKKRYNQLQLKLCEESASADMNCANSQAEIQQPLIIKKYEIANIYSRDEFGLQKLQSIPCLQRLN
ncbi:MAG: hypothetical protein EZS28_001812 [Streblomastix strix]|uniref:Uncharacterized protein n=1 Tax=Streblomastix strix TaxID=222440 RepID=A0A5J4X7F4_9EUKA|nr:MAG: hypothetical protein EZS28_001812 [Streblomastix strix]